MTARPYASLEVWSWELEEDSAVGVADMVANSMAQRMARAIQSDFFYGSGANVIQGVYGAAGLLKSAEGGTANAVAPSSSAGYDYWDKAIQAVRTAKADVDMVVTSPVGYQTYGRLKNTQNDAIRPSPTVQAYLNGTGGPNGDGKCYVTTAIRDTSTAGTAANDCSDLFFLWSPFIYTAIKHQFSILPLRERFSTERQAGAIAWCRLDAFVAHTEAQALLQAKTS
jgi:HK97 family phage major capsid protein